jgi:hypothetical protein
MLILSTPNDDFRKDLLSKPKDYKITDAIETGKEYEAIDASQISLKNLQGSTTNVDALKYKQRNCQNCGLQHKPRSCPAYHDKCNACGTPGHWKIFCRKSKRNHRSQSLHSRNQNHTRRNSPNRHDNHRGTNPNNRSRRDNRKVSHNINVDDEYEEKADEVVFDSIEILTINDQVTTKPNEAFIMLKMKHDQASGALKAKIDTGSGGNTLPVRTYNQMFGNTSFHKLLKNEPHVHLTSYCGNNIKCFGSINLSLKKDSQHNFCTFKFYVVDVQGPVIIGLKTCEKLGIVEINLDSLSKQIKHVKKCPTEINSKINTIEDLKSKFPTVSTKLAVSKALKHCFSTKTINHLSIHLGDIRST